MAEFTLEKPDIVTDKILTKTEQLQVETALKKQGRKLIHKEVMPAKNDYQHDCDRGTVEYTPKSMNYSFHKVIIPDGTVIRNTNFTQKEPHSQAIQGKNLTFIDCNLVNVEKDISWILQGCNNCQIKRFKKSEKDIDGIKEVTISHQVEKGGVFVEVEKETHLVSSEEYDALILQLNADN